MYNKRKFNKLNDKKILHKVKKQWVTISLALFLMIGGSVATHITVSANSLTSQKPSTEIQQNKSTQNSSKGITNNATQLHAKLINNANKQTIRLGGHRGSHVLKSHYKRSNSSRALKNSGYKNTRRYGGNFIFNKYAPNSKRAIVPKKLSLRYLNWAQGRFGKLNLKLFTHKHNGWTKLSRHNARKYKSELKLIYKASKKSNHKSHRAKAHTKYVSKNTYKKYNHQLKNYKRLMKHGSKWARKYNKRAYYSLKNNMKSMKIRNKKRSHRRKQSHSKHKSSTTTSTTPNQSTTKSGQSATIPSDNDTSDDNSTKKPDATHKYLVPSNYGSDVVLTDNDINKLRANTSDNYSDYDNDVSDNSDVPLVHIIGDTNLDGFNLKKVVAPSDNTSDNGWVFSDELNSNKDAHANDSDFKNLSNSLENSYKQSKAKQHQAEMQKDFTPSEIAQINNIQSKYNYLESNENSSDVSNISAYRQRVVDWVNFYRGLYGLTPVTEDASFDDKAQSGAETGEDPEDMLMGDPGGSTGSAPSDVNIYVTDTDDADHDGEPGHRVSVLNPRATKIGVGANGGQDTLFFDYGFNNPKYQNSSMTYPNAGVFPLDLANQGQSDYWGYSFINNDTSNSDETSDNYNEITPTNLNVSVHDDTANSNVSVSNVHADDQDEGDDYSGAIYYSVDTNALKSGHQYTITISGQGIPNGSYTYTTKLFSVNHSLALARSLVDMQSYSQRFQGTYRY